MFLTLQKLCQLYFLFFLFLRDFLAKISIKSIAEEEELKKRKGKERLYSDMYKTKLKSYFSLLLCNNNFDGVLM